MDFELSAESRALRDQVQGFFDRHILPRNREWHEWVATHGAAEPPFLAELKARARKAGLWNLALPKLADDEPGQRCSNLAFAPLAESMGRVPWGSEVFNCHAPDVPNMEVLQMFATHAQKEEWLRPLLDGTIRSAFAMTEPDVASSDASNIATTIRREGDEYVIDGRKWFATGASHPECRLLLVVGVTNPEAGRTRRHSIVLVPTHTPGLTVLRNLSVFGHSDPIGPHPELLFEGVRIPTGNLLGSEGAGFAIGQARLGPARVHHCMRAIGACEVLLALMLQRARRRHSFGQDLADNATVQQWIALSRMQIEAARLMVLKTAWELDRVGNKGARQSVSLIKVLVARAYSDIADRAVQLFGAAGATDDSPVAAAFTKARLLRIYDGPDEVHYRTIFKLEADEAISGNRDLSQYLSGSTQRVVA
jgi:acyl-CoA dehydrogenase